MASNFSFCINWVCRNLMASKLWIRIAFLFNFRFKVLAWEPRILYWTHTYLFIELRVPQKSSVGCIHLQHFLSEMILEIWLLIHWLKWYYTVRRIYPVATCCEIRAFNCPCWLVCDDLRNRIFNHATGRGHHIHMFACISAEQAAFSLFHDKLRFLGGFVDLGLNFVRIVV